MMGPTQKCFAKNISPICFCNTVCHNSLAFSPFSLFRALMALLRFLRFVYNNFGPPIRASRHPAGPPATGYPKPVPPHSPTTWRGPTRTPPQAGLHGGPMRPQAGPVGPQAGPMGPQAGPTGPQAGPMGPQAGPMGPQSGPMGPQAGPMGPQ